MVLVRAMSRRILLSWEVLLNCWVACCIRRPNCALSSSSNSCCNSTGFLFLNSLALDFMINRPLVVQQRLSGSEVWQLRDGMPAGPTPHRRHPFHITLCLAESLPQNTPDYLFRSPS